MAKWASDAERTASARAARYALRELVDGRLVATTVPPEKHGKPWTYIGWGCRCWPCTDANTATSPLWSGIPGSERRAAGAAGKFLKPGCSAAKIIEVMVSTPDERLGVYMLAERTGLSRSTVGGTLGRLVEHGWVRQCEQPFPVVAKTDPRHTARSYLLTDVAILAALNRDGANKQPTA